MLLLRLLQRAPLQDFRICTLCPSPKHSCEVVVIYAFLQLRVQENVEVLWYARPNTSCIWHVAEGSEGSKAVARNTACCSSTLLVIISHSLNIFSEVILTVIWLLVILIAASGVREGS